MHNCHTQPSLPLANSRQQVFAAQSSAYSNYLKERAWAKANWGRRGPYECEFEPEEVLDCREQSSRLLHNTAEYMLANIRVDGALWWQSRGGVVGTCSASKTRHFPGEHF